ncbi:MAG: hypothetical protein FWC23_01145 [Chitinispirillia bacterium]|nr:hypothetical protein [Chitinispirillia bacterium]MCL2267782.1 hypothetical protein [Chitinispirillia bacterium]
MSKNNPKCFVFAIGGTGSRVLRSLTHLLASGVKPEKNNFDIIPIIIDPHYGNEDLQRTVRMLDWYKNVKKISDPNGFFPTKIYTLEDLKSGDPDKSDTTTTFTFRLSGSGDKFRDYIDHGNMGAENAALAELLFSGSTKNKNGEDCDLLDIQMDIGFVGNPNVGSVVLNQIVESEIFDAFARNFKPENDDRIFIISSIFGGTGAAGFPCLLKNIRDGKGDASINLKTAKIGAVSVLPYFKLEKNDDSAINYSDFIAKTKSALYYYGKNVTGNKSVNVMYYLGDNPGNSYNNDPGYGGQKNKSHFVELAGALALINFLSIPANDHRLECEINTDGDNAVGRAKYPVCNEFSIQENTANPTFFDFKTETQRLMAMPLSQFALFRKYMEEEYRGKKREWKKEPPEVDDSFLTDGFYRDNLKRFFDDFHEWLVELHDNNRGFAPFNLADNADLASFIKGVDIESKTGIAKLFSKAKPPAYMDLETFLNMLAKDKKSWSAEKKMMDVFHGATHKLLDELYGLNDKTGGPKK